VDGAGSGVVRVTGAESISSETAPGAAAASPEASEQRRPPAEDAAPRIHNRGWLIRRSLAAADLIGLVVAFLVAESVIHDSSGAPDALRGYTEYLVFLASLPGWVLLARQYGLYSLDEEHPAHSTADDVLGVFNMLTVGTWVFFVFTWLTDLAQPSVPKLVVFWACALVAISILRATARSICRRRDAYLQNTIVFGAGRVGQLVAKKLSQHPEYGVTVVGFVDDDAATVRQAHPEGMPVLGSSAQLAHLVRELQVERVIVAFPETSRADKVETIRALNEIGVHVDVVPDLFEIIDSQARTHAAEGLTLIGLRPARWERSSLLLKRTLDLTVSAVALVLLSPLFAAIAVAIVLDSRGPVFFRQVRIGTGERPFRMLKFRTMVADADAHREELAHLNKHANGDPRMFKIPDDPRVTRVGRILRAYSLDEFPQLVNVLRGEMSLVGPRPLVPDEHRHVSGWRRTRLQLKPGITGLWQVLGRDGIPFEEMVELDYRYVKYWSVTNDLKLIARTLPLLRRRPLV
jgi:exopolysaccharide biosynthesis polyprenyl glycosylphosphotransferase